MLSSSFSRCCFFLVFSNSNLSFFSSADANKALELPDFFMSTPSLLRSRRLFLAPIKKLRIMLTSAARNDVTSPTLLFAVRSASFIRLVSEVMKAPTTLSMRSKNLVCSLSVVQPLRRFAPIVFSSLIAVSINSLSSRLHSSLNRESMSATSAASVYSTKSASKSSSSVFCVPGGLCFVTRAGFRSISSSESPSSSSKSLFSSSSSCPSSSCSSSSPPSSSSISP
mmetsp:Transcript_3862/g.6979  ORF Transcript_3862/g.6979 Transcript_3862/m.6979 type:complete len:225 (-) Transcript_3862:73-747(-)